MSRRKPMKYVISAIVVSALWLFPAAVGSQSVTFMVALDQGDRDPGNESYAPLSPWAYRDTRHVPGWTCRYQANAVKVGITCMADGTGHAVQLEANCATERSAATAAQLISSGSVVARVAAACRQTGWTL